MPDRFSKRKHPSDCDCEDCLTAWGDHMEGIFEADRLGAHDPERAGGAKPATNREWREFLDREWPVAAKGVA